MRFLRGFATALFNVAWLAAALANPFSPGAALTGPLSPNVCTTYTIPGGNLNANPDFDANWTTTGSTKTANNAFSPACATNGATLVEDSSTGGHQIHRDIASAYAAQPYTYSFFAGRVVGTRNIEAFVFESVSFTAFAAVGVDLGTCTIFQGPTVFDTFTTVSASAMAYFGSWCKVSMTWTTAVTTSMLFIVNMLGDTSSNYTGNGTNSVKVWGGEVR